MPESKRSDRPIFVVGSGRSGTTLVAHVLQAAEEFPVYMAETRFMLARFTYGNLRDPHAANRFAEDLLRSRQWARSGLTDDRLKGLLEGCSGYTEFLGRFMDAVAESQGKSRWSEKTPANVAFVPEIVRCFPTARFVHIVRDGRDVALSIQKLGWVPNLGGSRVRQLLWAGERWRHRTALARRHLRNGPPTIWIRFEDLVTKTEEIVQQLGDFCEIRIDLNQAISSKFGSFGSANTAFGDTEAGVSSSTAGRWRSKLDESEQAILTHALATELNYFGYPVPNFPIGVVEGAKTSLERRAFGVTLRGKEWIRTNTPLGRRTTTPLEIGLD